MLEGRKHDDPTGSSKRNKLGADELTRSSKKKKTISHGGGETTELLISGDLHLGSNQCSIWSKLSKEVASNLSRSVVSLSLLDGQEFACSGIAIERVGDVTRFVTSASLARALIDKRLDHDSLKVEVRLGRDVITGVLGEYDLDHGIAFVNVMSALDVHFVPLNNLVALAPDCKVLALGHGMSGDVHVMCTDGVLTGDSSGELKLSTCKISKVYEGGPLFDFGGNFLGMNFFRDTERTFFLPARMLCHWMVRIKCLRGKYRARPNFFKAVSVGQRCRGEVRNPNSNQEVHIDVPPMDQFEGLGYPKPSISMLNDGMILINTCEEPFGDGYGNGVWSELSGAVSSRIQENIVALASFNGEIRFSACTGFIIEFDGCSTILTSASLVREPYEDKIVENLRIKVLLPTNQSVEGTLQHYNLHYNIALVSVKGFCPSRPEKIQHLWNDHSGDVVSIGYCFESRKLMAGRGRPFGRPNLLDCKYICYSTCKITKAAIGGPLLGFDGRFFGMNFYGEVQGTPYLHWSVILCALEHFKTEGSSVAKVDHAGKPSHLLDWTMAGDRSVSLTRWFVPEPYWCHPDEPKICTEPFFI